MRPLRPDRDLRFPRSVAVITRDFDQPDEGYGALLRRAATGNWLDSPELIPPQSGDSWKAYARRSPVLLGQRPSEALLPEERGAQAAAHQQAEWEAAQVERRRRRDAEADAAWQAAHLEKLENQRKAEADAKAKAQAVEEQQQRRQAEIAARQPPPRDWGHTLPLGAWLLGMCDQRTQDYILPLMLRPELHRLSVTASDGRLAFNWASEHPSDIDGLIRETRRRMPDAQIWVRHPNTDYYRVEELI
jgi:hypothetical protein